MGSASNMDLIYFSSVGCRLNRVVYFRPHQKITPHSTASTATVTIAAKIKPKMECDTTALTLSNSNFPNTNATYMKKMQAPIVIAAPAVRLHMERLSISHADVSFAVSRADLSPFVTIALKAVSRIKDSEFPMKLFLISTGEASLEFGGNLLFKWTAGSLPDAPRRMTRPGTVRSRCSWHCTARRSGTGCSAARWTRCLCSSQKKSSANSPLR